MNAAISASGYGEIVTQKRQQFGVVEITFASGRSLLVSNFLGTYVDPGDEIKLALPCSGETLSTSELLIKRLTGACVYQTSVGYAAKPKTDKVHHPYVHVEIAGGTLGFTALHLPCAALRDYFYSPHRSHNPDSQSPYEVLRTRRGASPGDLRLAYKLRELELCATSAPRMARNLPSYARLALRSLKPFPSCARKRNRSRLRHRSCFCISAFVVLAKHRTDQEMESS